MTGLVQGAAKGAGRVFWLASMLLLAFASGQASEGSSQDRLPEGARAAVDRFVDVVGLERCAERPDARVIPGQLTEDEPQSYTTQELERWADRSCSEVAGYTLLLMQGQGDSYYVIGHLQQD